MEYITLHNGEKTRVDLELYDFFKVKKRQQWYMTKTQKSYSVNFLN